ncbi:MAG TPA: hypothetical protein DDZ80_27345, partial [Cyanobacteria bacterium UBA8803]|nr:hypothetical protein [Cyanobacteria bacterium UBA8803]
MERIEGILSNETGSFDLSGSSELAQQDILAGAIGKSSVPGVGMSTPLLTELDGSGFLVSAGEVIGSSNLCSIALSAMETTMAIRGTSVESEPLGTALHQPLVSNLQGDQLPSSVHLSPSFSTPSLPYPLTP